MVKIVSWLTVADLLIHLPHTSNDSDDEDYSSDSSRYSDDDDHDCHAIFQLKRKTQTNKKTPNKVNITKKAEIEREISYRIVSLRFSFIFALTRKVTIIIHDRT